MDRSLIPSVSNNIIFKFVTRKSIGVKYPEAALNAIWRPSVPANVFAVGDSIFMAGFENAVDCNKILAHQPWHFSNSLMVFKKAVGNERISDLILNEVSFWVQIHGLKLQLQTRYVGQLLGNKIGRVLEVDCTANALAWGKCLRVRILLNVYKPLIRGTILDFNVVTTYMVFRCKKWVISILYMGG